MHGHCLRYAPWRFRNTDRDIAREQTLGQIKFPAKMPKKIQKGNHDNLPPMMFPY